MGENSKEETSPGDSPVGSDSGTIPQGAQQDEEMESELTRLTLVARHMSPGELDEQSRFHYDQFVRYGRLNEIGKAIEYATLALEATPEGDPYLAMRENNLGILYDDRFGRLDILDDLERAIEHGSRAVALTTEGDPNLTIWLGNLGNFYSDRFHRLGGMHDLEKATEHYTRAFTLTPTGHPELSNRHTALGVTYADRFRQLGEMRDLEKAIEHFSEALELAPNGHPSLPNRHANLGAFYTDRFRQLGEMHDLEKAIEHDSRALALTPDGHPSLADRRASLGVSYTDRFRRLGELHDLEKAIQHFSEALKLTPDGHPSLSDRHDKLGASYIDRFQQLGKIHDLEKAIQHCSRALELTPDGHPSLADRRSNLGLSYTTRFQQLGEMHDIEKATKHFSVALELTPNSHPSLPNRHTNLGVSYTYRFEQLGEINDLERAIQYQSHALKLTPDGHPDLADRYFGHAYALFSQYEHSQDPAHFKASLDLYRKASQLSTGAPRVVFRNALRWATRAVRHSSLNCIEAYQTTIDLLPQFVWLGATTAQRYHDLTQTENLAINAANAAILQSDPSLALEWLEHARCVVWNQSLMLRTPLDQLHSSYPDLSFRLKSVSNQLHEAGTQTFKSQPLTLESEDHQRVGQNRRRLARGYSDLVDEARTLPGFESFLQPMKAQELVRAARYGPVVVINCHKDRCDALVIIPGEARVKHIPLPDFTADNAKGMHVKFHLSGLRQRGVKPRPEPRANDRVAEVLLDLWIKITKPVLASLGYLDPSSTDNLPHITWCPTGPLSFLPLHAAGDYGSNGSKVFDYAISSYTPTVTSLFEATPSVLDDGCQVLAIGQASTPGHSPLPGTAQELKCIKSRIEDRVSYSQLTGSQATTTAVLDAMERHDWVHLACHAHQNVEDPTSSGFHLHDGTLDLASINQRQFRGKGLAFLSACQTATGDEKLPDEAVHLASGMLMAGYTSVIATMWSVYDSDAPIVAEKVYERLMEDRKLGNGEAGRALHYAVGELRKSVGENAFGRWVPYIHIGS